MKSTENSLRSRVYNRLSAMIIAGDVRPGESRRAFADAGGAV